MSAFGFDASVLRRLALGGGFCVAACILVWLVEREGARAAEAPAVAMPDADVRAVPLMIESTYPIDAWTVSVNGEPAIPDRSNGTTWSGWVGVTPDAELLVIGAGPATGSANRCLRLRIGDAEPRLVWGGGDVTATVALP